MGRPNVVVVGYGFAGRCFHTYLVNLAADLNLYGVLHCTKAVVDGMCERNWGRVINISSGAGQTGIRIGISIYGAGKGAAISFMRHFAMEVAGTGVTANTLALGLIDNHLDAQVTAAMAGQGPGGGPALSQMNPCKE